MSSESGGRSSADLSSPPAPPAAPAARPVRRVSVLASLLFYSFLFSVAWVWLASVGVDPRVLWMPGNLALEVVLGVGAGLVLAGVAPWFLKGIPSLRELERAFGWLLGEQRRWECVVLAVVSGVSEEFFFRGAAHTAMGPLSALIIFAALHWPVSREFRLWPVTALFAGAVLAAERIVTAGLIAPVLTHIVVNAINMLRITAKYRVWKE